MSTFKGWISFLYIRYVHDNNKLWTRLCQMHVNNVLQRLLTFRLKQTKPHYHPTHSNSFKRPQSCQNVSTFIPCFPTSAQMIDMAVIGSEVHLVSTYCYTLLTSLQGITIQIRWVNNSLFYFFNNTVSVRQALYLTHIMIIWGTS